MLGVDPAFAGTVAFALSAGLATFFAPCAYPLLPGYVGYYLSQEDAALDGALVRGVAASLGALFVLGGFGLLVLGAGQRFVSNLAVVEPVIGALLVVLGLAVLLGRGPSLHVILPERRASVAGFGLFGGVYAVAAAGCVVPLFVGVVTQALTRPPLGSAAVFATYAGSVAAPLVGVTLLAGAGVDAWRSAGRHGRLLERLAGGVMVLAGIGQLALSASVLGWV